MKILLSSVAFSMTLVLSASCGVVGGSDKSDGPGGKADDARNCDDAGERCLDFRKYEVLFTNPICQTLAYDSPVETADGGTVGTKPKNVYCTREDAADSAARDNAPEKRLLDWVNPLEAGDEIFLAYLSYSNRTVGDALCRAAERGVKVTFVLDKPTARGDELKACGGDVLIRGHQGSVGFAHVKLIMVNPDAPGPADDDDKHIKLSFGSGNMSSGTVLHHENWHFMEVARDSFFVEAHRCLIEGLTDAALTDGKTPFKVHMNECRDRIAFEPETDIQSFFIPNVSDTRAINKLMEDGIADADSIDIGAHRFSYNVMVDALEERLANDPDFELHLVADDDLYWLRPLAGAPRQVGPNDFFEADRVDRLAAAGGDRFEVRYLETNHSLHLLHHNKFLILKGIEGRPDAVLTGSPNLTSTGFKDNLENVYWIEIPVVLDAYRTQFDLFWDGDRANPAGPTPPAATRPGDMPVEDITLTSDNAVDDPEPGVPDLVINEVLADPPAGFDANGDGITSTSADEFIEIINNGSTAIDLSGATISDAVSVRVTLPAGTSLEPGQALVVFGGGNPTRGNFAGALVVTGNGSLFLNNGGDTITLADTDGDPLATLTFGSSSDESLVRSAERDGSAQMVPHTSLSAAIASPGTTTAGAPF